MEEDYETRSKRKKNKTSVALCFVVAIASITFLSVFGILNNQETSVSYAADDNSAYAGDSFTFKHIGNFIEADENSSGDRPYNVNIFCTGDNCDDDVARNPVYCVQAHVDPPGPGSSIEYDRGNHITDYGLLYLLNEEFTVPTSSVCTTDDCTKLVTLWIRQTAIWKYLKDKYPNDDKHTYKFVPDVKKLTVKKIVENDEPQVVKVIYDGTALTGDGNNSNYIVDKLVKEAKSASADRIISVAVGDEMTKVDDEYYQTSMVTVTTGDYCNQYDITLSGVNGAFIVNEDGEEMDSEDVSCSVKNFYVRIPAENVTEEKQTLTIGVNGTFDVLDGHEFVAAGDTEYQKVVTVTGSTRDISNRVSIPVVGVPDTGMNTAQTIYFVGLIVLLCGVGIIYANAKPVETKQQ